MLPSPHAMRTACRKLMPRAFVCAQCAIVLALVSRLWSQELKPQWTGSEIQVSTSKLHFLTGKTLETIRDGRAVSFDFQLSFNSGGSIVRRALERFIISYDLWEERFLVTRLAREQSQRKQAPRLTQDAAEAWCLENIIISTDGLPSDKPFSIQLEIRAEEQKESRPILAEPGISLAALIDLFSKPAKLQQPKWMTQSAPLRFVDIRK
jgi:hypothetical protein